MVCGTMKGFERSNQLFSLCGLNCGLCTMHVDYYCPGCGGGAGNQSCKIAKCSLEHGSLEYCFQCNEYPCERYLHIDEFDSFVSHQNQKIDIERAKKIGIDAYNSEQMEKIEILKHLLSSYNDGRRRTFYCIAINLLDLQDVKKIMGQISQLSDFHNKPLKEKSAYVVSLFQDMARTKKLELKLRKKK